MSVAVVYDPRYHTWDSWASLMCEAYAGQNLQIPGPNTDWKAWGAGLKAIDIFMNDAIPEPYTYQNWQEWAEAVVGAVNQKTE